MKLFIEFQNLPSTWQWFSNAQTLLCAHRQMDLREGHATFIRLEGPTPAYRVKLMLVGHESLTLSDATSPTLPEAWSRACTALEFSSTTDGFLQSVDAHRQNSPVTTRA